MKKKSFEEIIDFDGELNIVEEFLNIDSSLIEMEKNKDLIRMEMNIVEFPIFSKNTLVKINQIRKYYFSTDMNSYLEILPALNTQIPGEIEERVFIALTKILRNNGFKQTFYCTLNDILDNMKIYNRGTRNSLYPKIRQAISKMASTTFRFKNLFYSNELNKPIDDLIETNILTFRQVTLKDATDTESYFFSDKRVREIYKITISQHFYENIIRKGYLAFDADELLNIKDAVTRSIYTMITKWRNNKLYLIKPAYFIARRIPLSWDKNPRRTVLRIEESFKFLKENNYITHYNMKKAGKWETAEFELFFDEVHNKIKRDNFFDEKSIFDKMVHKIEDRLTEIDVNTPSLFNDPQFIAIYNIFPEVAKRYKTLPMVIREALKNNEYEYVKFTAEYTALNCKTSYIKYFKEAITHNWADEYIAKKELKNLKKNQKIENIEEAILVEKPKKNLLSVTWEEFERLEINKKNEIIEIAYKEFLEESEGTDNKMMRGIFEKSKKPLVLKVFDRQSKDSLETLDKAKENNLSFKKEESTKESQKNQRKSEVINSNSNMYATTSMFILECLKYFRENNIQINTQDFMTLFSFMKEYEDEKVILKYSEETKLGEIIRK